jgi:antitoxin (DNA-binding transcriptional repressor) of toxin-antitoxin stability system
MKGRHRAALFLARGQDVVYTYGVHNEPGRIGIRDLRANLSALLRRVRNGATYVVMSRDQVVAELRPPASPGPKPRRPGRLKGRIRMAADFDTFPDDLLEAIES